VNTALKNGHTYLLKTYDQNGVQRPMSEWDVAVAVVDEKTRNAKLIDKNGLYRNEWLENMKDVIDILDLT